ncbi:MAG: hypothetical protein VW311_09225 [Gammaproteobacteria bacterium]
MPRLLIPGAFLALVSLFQLSLPAKALTLTAEEEAEYIGMMNSPEVSEIRRYLDACLSGDALAPEAQYPCKSDGSTKGDSILEHPRHWVKGRFAVIYVNPYLFGGKIFTLIFAAEPHLAVDVWVYTNEGIAPDMRSFSESEISAAERLKMAADLGAYLKDKRFLR